MMILQMNRGTGLLLLVLAGWLPAYLSSAGQPDHGARRPLERAGRLFGVCWGDGYHACSSSGKRLLADLPPQSNLARPVSHYKSVVTRHHHGHGATFYDRFDALNQSLFHTSECCIPGCEIVDCDGQRCHNRCKNTACDSPGCDGSCDGAGPSYASERGVLMAPGDHLVPTQVRDPSEAVNLPSFSGPPQPEFAAPAQVAPEPAAPEPAAPEPAAPEPATPGQPDAGNNQSEALPEPLRAPEIKPSKPIKPAAPAEESSDALFDPLPILTAPLAAADPATSKAAIRLPVETSPVSPLPNAFLDFPDPVARQSPMPVRIVPEFPTRQGSSRSKPALTDPSAYARTMERPARLGQATDSLHPVTRPSSQATMDAAQAAPATVADKPSRLGNRATGPTTTGPTTTGPTTTGQVTAGKTKAPATQTVVAQPGRPTRLGAASNGPVANPFAARPIVEMAKRTSTSDEGVVRQPSQLK